MPIYTKEYSINFGGIFNVMKNTILSNNNGRIISIADF